MAILNGTDDYGLLSHEEPATSLTAVTSGLQHQTA
ncbi:hypothetical protein WRSd3_p00031 (plasmid) [Shigella dysenteriae WRSd3]|uniref:Uncharacterized protein n=1 Tax=Shigella dysenteriae WRSd3 TaxID=1401327 RepID=A0A090N9C9_SHIDY|nr:hypothetical protein WRSd3_p00031 [Shigella dysenteriae WRSd3]